MVLIMRDTGKIIKFIFNFIKKPNFSGRIIHDDCESFEGDWENGIA